MGWGARDIPDQAGKTIVVTGANSGIGYCAAAALARRGATVVMACRDEQRGRAAIDRIRVTELRGTLELASLDLADLASVRSFAKELRDRPEGVDVLVNNAGLMAVPQRATTADGFELQLGTNHLGHFALTIDALPALLVRPGARVVTVSSNAHRTGRIHFDDLQSERRYTRWGAYGQSKLANLLFAFELDRRLRRAGRDTISVAAHPGWTTTNLQSSGPSHGGGGGLMVPLMRVGNGMFGQPDRAGALPTLYAATAPDVLGGEYFGPSRLLESRGAPKRVSATGRARDVASAERLWAVSETLTGVRLGAL